MSVTSKNVTKKQPPLAASQYTEKIASTQKKLISQTDKDLVILSSKTYVFEDKLTKY